MSATDDRRVTCPHCGRRYVPTAVYYRNGIRYGGKVRRHAVKGAGFGPICPGSGMYPSPEGGTDG